MVDYCHRWSKIASRLPGRTDNEIKNHWNTHIKKKLIKMGIDPITHEPLNKQTTSQDSTNSSPADNFPHAENNHEVKGTDGVVVNSEENSSSSPAENSSGEDSLLLDSICSDDSLMNSLWLDETPLVEALWEWDNTTVIEENTKNDMSFVPSWEDNCSWLLDCQDFGIHDFGFNCFNEKESSTIQTIDMKENSKH